MNPINVAIKSSATWLKLSPTSGTTGFDTTVSVDPTGLVVGTYTANISIVSTSEAICNPALVEIVTLIIVAKPRTKPGKGPRK